MGLMISPESPLGKEYATWNRPRTSVDDDGRPGMRAPGFEPFPRMVYKAVTLPSGAVRCMEPMPDPRQYADLKLFERDVATVDQFNRNSCRIVKNEEEYARATADGWRDSPADALAHHEGLQRDVATAAAEAAASAQTLSKKAQADRKRREDATDGHLTE